MLSHNINSAFRAAVVGFSDVVTSFIEEVFGQFFSRYIGIFTFHFSGELSP